MEHHKGVEKICEKEPCISLEMDSKYKPKRLSTRRKKNNAHIVDETKTKVGSQCIWLWVAIEPKHREILQIDMPVEGAMLVAEKFIASLIDKYGKQSVSIHGGTW